MRRQMDSGKCLICHEVRLYLNESNDRNRPMSPVIINTPIISRKTPEIMLMIL